MAALGYHDLKPETLIRLRIFGITPDYARAFADRGAGSPSTEQLVKLRIAGIGPKDLGPRR